MQKKNRIVAYLKFIREAFLVNIKCVIEYRANFLLQFFGMILNNSVFALFWFVVIDRTGGIGGYGFSDIMIVLALSSTAFGLAHVLFGNIRHIGRIVMTGGLDVYLLQPKDAWLNVIISKTSLSAWGDFVYGYIVLALLPGTTILHVILFTLLIIPGALIFAAVFAAAESLVFFMQNSQAISSALSEFLLSFSLYPEGVFANEMRFIFYSIIPAGFISFMPLRIFKAFDWTMVPILWLIAILYVALSYVVFQVGVKRYESGNKMDSRI